MDVMASEHRDVLVLLPSQEQLRLTVGVSRALGGCGGEQSHGGEQGRGGEQGCGGEQSHGGKQGYGVSRALGHSLCTEKSLDRLTLLTPGTCEVLDGQPFYWACEGNITDRRCCEK